MKDFEQFSAWCGARGLAALPADPITIARYVADLAAHHKVATIARHIASISVTHKRENFVPSPTSHPVVRETLAGIRRELGVAQLQKAPLVIEDLRRVVRPLDGTPQAIRDRALLLVGFAGAFRRSELVSLDVADVAAVVAGLEITLRKSKTDQEGKGVLIGVPYGSSLATCPVRALQAWLALLPAEGPIFRAIDRAGHIRPSRLTAQSVALIVKRRARAAGVTGDLSGHSLRAGFATTAANEGVSLHDSMRQTRHRSATEARKYVRRATAWEHNAATRVGL